ncbi:unnamed protein product [Prorocentrum cordatum]|uniref:Uncharacterized protein n=1 Tax=Prorocentrum cordatum TaxID=2364126 RepID=A0ABN9RLQ5_9DINO|nr:unnamed protein product [Polarella glacialis]
MSVEVAWREERTTSPFVVCCVVFSMSVTDIVSLTFSFPLLVEARGRELEGRRRSREEWKMSCAHDVGTAQRQCFIVACSCESNLGTNAYQDSDCLVSAAFAQSDAEPCMWLRGLFPSSYSQVPPPPVSGVLDHHWDEFGESGGFSGIRPSWGPSHHSWRRQRRKNDLGSSLQKSWSCDNGAAVVRAMPSASFDHRPFGWKPTDRAALRAAWTAARPRGHSRRHLLCYRLRHCCCRF